MKIPYFILILLPASIRERHIQKIWDKRTDDEIVASHDDAMSWIELADGFFSDSLADVVKSCQSRLDNYILPQMEKRGLKND